MNDCRHSGYVNYGKDYFVTFSLLGVARVRFGYAPGTYVGCGYDVYYFGVVGMVRYILPCIGYSRTIFLQV